MSAAATGARGTRRGYVGRFAPSPSGPLHAGSLVAALASWLDARAHGGRWLLRFDDLDAPRCLPGMEHLIVQQLAVLGLQPDTPPLWQSQRGPFYAQALDSLRAAGLSYPCGCTRRDIEGELAALGLAPARGAERIYPGTCRSGLQGKPARAWRLAAGSDAAPVFIDWHDRRLGPQHQDVTHAVGDFVLQRADGPWAYQLATVVDDAEQGISDVVRGEDLADNTARQIHLQQLLGLPTPRYLHTALVRDERGEKLSKSNGAAPLDLQQPLAPLRAAAVALNLGVPDSDRLGDWLAGAVNAWRARWAVALAPGARHPAESGPSSLQHGTSDMNTTPSGLQIDDLTAGSGATAQAGNRVAVHYTGWLYDPTKDNGRGKKFDSSKDRGDPFKFELGAGMVIRGWDEGVQGMQVGGTRVLRIPPEMGYGARGAGGVIPPNATLVFEVELLGV